MSDVFCVSKDVETSLEYYYILTWSEVETRNFMHPRAGVTHGLDSHCKPVLLYIILGCKYKGIALIKHFLFMWKPSIGNLISLESISLLY